MATPQESVTTVNGRRCTRSRVRTAATSTPIPTPAAPPTDVAPTESSTTIVAQVPAQQPAASPPAPQEQPPSQPSAPPPPQPPAPTAPSSPVEASAIVSLPTSQVAASSAAGTGNEVLISLATTPLPAVVEPSISTTADSIFSPLSQFSETLIASQIAAATTLPPARIAPTSSDTVETAVIPPQSSESPLPSPSSPPSSPSSSPSPTTPAAAQPVVTESAGAARPTSVAAVPDINPTISSSQTPSLVTSIAELLSQTGSAALGDPTRAPVGVIAPEQGSHSAGSGHSSDGHSSHDGSDPNLGGIVGGVVGGFVALGLLSALLFFCLRRRKSREGSWNEKSEQSSGFASSLKAVPKGFGGIFARLRNEKTGPIDYPYQRHQPRSSVGSVYSTTSSGRGRSISEPQGQSAVGGGFVRRMSSRKSERNVLRKKTSSVSSQSPFVGITEEPTYGTNNVGTDPFADPTPNTPRNLRISNPDTAGEPVNGPIPPQPTATPLVARDPFASLIDEIDGAPDWLRDSNFTASTASNHHRTISAASALKSHPPSSVYSRSPFADPSPIPPLPTQNRTTQQPQPRLSTYSAFPAARESNLDFFGEPGPSRPGTNYFAAGLLSNPAASRPGTNIFNTAAITPGLPTSTSRLDRQSDPFDLDRPEVLSFKGIMSQMRDSIARTTTVKSRRTSSVGAWFGGRDSSTGGALNGASIRR